MVAHGSTCQELHGSFLNARRVRAQRFIEERCIDPRLDAQRVADHLGISLRSLHLAFESTGASVGSRILSARLGRARDLLVRFPKRSILDIALDCGFDNLATFYRGFSCAYGHPLASSARVSANTCLACSVSHGGLTRIWKVARIEKRIFAQREERPP
jgi:transcriptional regulator GlxA family with amidase domain